MKTEILYVELIQQFDHRGSAWIGYGQFSKSGRTVYFNGKVFGRGQGSIGNHVALKVEKNTGFPELKRMVRIDTIMVPERFTLTNL